MRSGVNRRVPGGVYSIGVRTVSEEQLDQAHVAKKTGIPQCRLARAPSLATLRIDIRSVFDQQLGDLELFIRSGGIRTDDPMQECASF